MRSTLIALIIIGGLVVLGRDARADEVRTNPAPGLGDYNAPFWEDGTYRADVETPSDYLGLELGSRPLELDEIERYLTYLDETFPNVQLHEYARSYEGRPLFYLVITSEQNAGRLEELRTNLSKLADPRRLSGDDDVDAIIESNPAAAWMGYAIHGDELSSTDAAVQLAYQLTAGTDAVTDSIRDNVIVCIDPLQNPDGRNRWLTQLEQWNSVVTNTDVQSFHHKGQWPYGRGNHYLFDLNRDWFALVHPESRGRCHAILDWRPQFVVDCHEMGPFDTYLFSPPRAPFNPFMVSHIYKWWERLAKDQAAALDARGWSYYTREWNEELYPGYGSSWGIYGGAIGMLYEQASVDGSQVRRRDGTVMTYRETVHHQFVSSMANLHTVASHREELLRDYYSEKTRALKARRRGRRGGGPAFVFPASDNAGRLHRLARTLSAQDIDINVASEDFTIHRAQSSLGVESNVEVSRGALIVPLEQPMRPLIEAILTFDVRLPTDFLEFERKERLKNNTSQLYETTGWSLPLAFNVESYFTESLPDVDTQPLDLDDLAGRGGLANRRPTYGYVFANADDRSICLLARLLEHDVHVWASRKPFLVSDMEFPPGSFLIRLGGNPGISESMIDELAQQEGVMVQGVNTALGGELADLGGQEFVLLRAPRIAIVGGPTVSTYGFGTVWHLLDSRLRYNATTLDILSLHETETDLRKYNVLILPSSRAYKQLLGEKGLEALKSWVTDGGTLIAFDEATAFLADSSVALSHVRQKRQSLGKKKHYERLLQKAKDAEMPVVDSLDVWEAKPTGRRAAEGSAKGDTGDQGGDDALDSAELTDKKARQLSPRGVILAAGLDEEHWLSFGVRSPVPVMLVSTYAFVADDQVQVAARFADEATLRLSGLLWPEARERWSETAYVTREQLGRGQLILFADTPNFRAFFHGGERLLLNSIFLGPGFGSQTALDW